MVSVITVSTKLYAVCAKDCVESVKHHEPDVEIVLVDNGSPVPYAGDPCVLVRSDETISYSRAMNLGYSKATGDWLVFLNDDVVCTGPFVELIESLPIDGLYTVTLRHKETGKLLGQEFSYPYGWIVVVHRTTFERLGKWDENYLWASCEDLDIGLACEKHSVPMLEIKFPFRHLDGHTRRGMKGWRDMEAHNRNYLVQKWGHPPEPAGIETITPDKAGLDLYYRIQGHMEGRLLLWPVDAMVMYSLVNRDGNHLEVGCYDGGSAVFCAMAKMENNRDGLIYTIDLQERAIKDNAKRFGVEDRIIFMQTKVPPLPSILDGVEIETCLVDADHIAPAPLRDWGLVKDRVNRYVAFHDIHLLGPKAAFAEACADDKWEVVFAQTSHTKNFDAKGIVANKALWRGVGSIGVLQRITHPGWKK